MARSVAELGEEGVIRLLAERCPAAGRGGRLGIGDDAALLAESPWAVTTDLLVEGRHFDRAWCTPADVGHKALAASLSDAAAMGAAPGPFFLSLGLPGATPVADVSAFADGLAACARAAGAWLAGGDTVAAASW
ncbi:MAG: thiamine-phosphate kinase, partial [Nitrospirae bacterium]